MHIYFLHVARQALLDYQNDQGKTIKGPWPTLQ
jgi:hypothetical protein